MTLYDKRVGAKRRQEHKMFLVPQLFFSFNTPEAPAERLGTKPGSCWGSGMDGWGISGLK
jgi:hypothetical protein